ncbi:type I-E CRISPR-associated protein Cas5/CasD [Streptomyces sp. NBC_01618]|uniref:type I-E CRISPR-associated protein Cas5/CasD n=1 Tax=Streptomyces sp. NBC_01618 TaxID=2975900 RepID=UPI00386813E6|nr:type I-E CRISPR-associated protein Cas5/CasD [Streptomyces sp. NBC_01618]
MSGLLLRLAGPLQSWGERSAFTPVRDSAPFPTRSALTGMFAAAEGLGRGEQGIERYDSLHFTVRVDRPGVRLVDYHTVGGGFPKAQTAATSGGSNKGAAVITRRHYLADAVFTIAVTGPDTDTQRIAQALHRPHWAPYLGRRSCVPDEPFLLRAHVPDPLSELRHHVPLSREPERPEPDTVPVTFLYEQPPADVPEDKVDVLAVNDHPVSFAQHQRSHRTRRVYRAEHHLAHSLTSPRPQLMDRLIAYCLEENAA